jgi:hypothetical protein
MMKSPRRKATLALASLVTCLLLAPAGCGQATRHPAPLDPDTDGGVGAGPASGGSTSRPDSSTGDAASQPDSATDAATDGASDTGTTVSPSKVDPTRVYFYGWINPGFEPTKPCILDPLQPSTVIVGFPEATNGYFVIRADGGLTYSIVNGTDNALFVFVGDELGPAPGFNYPPTPLANDTKLATPACTTRPHGPVGVFPDDNVALHTCDTPGTDTYLVGSTTKFGIDLTSSTVLALGTTRTALLFSNGGWLFHKTDGTETPVVGFEPANGNITKMYAARFSKGSFMVAFENKAAPGAIELGHVALDATYTTAGTFTLGTYAGKFSDGFGGTSAALDDQGDLFALTRPVSTTQEVTQFHVGAAPAAVYNDNGGKALCKFWPETNGTVNTLIVAR